MIPKLGRQSQVDISEFKADLIYLVRQTNNIVMTGKKKKLQTEY